MNNETEQIFIINPSEKLQSVASQKTKESPAPQKNLHDVEDFSTVCRTCATVTDFVIPIFEGEGLQNNLAEKICKHLPIQVSPMDVLPLVVCYQCASTLLAWHELVACCAQADAALRTRHAAKQDPETTSEEAGPGPGQQKSETFISQLKNIFTEHYPSILINDDQMDMEFVCQKCESHPAATSIEALAGHLTMIHSDICGASAVKTFIENYITLEETLGSDNSDMEVTEPLEQQTRDTLPNFYCPFCKSVFSSTSRLMAHLNKHVPISVDHVVECCSCEETFNTQKLFIEHLQKHHVNHTSDQTTNNCRTCGFEADSLQDLENHILTTHKDRKYSTETVSQKQKEPSLKNQKFIPAVCPECNKVFSNKYNMFTHMKSHSEQPKEFPCDKCAKSFRSQGSLTAHRKQAHEGVLKHCCSFCGEAFPTRLARTLHERIHSGHTPYSCQYCSKSFRAKNTLDWHIEMHLDIRKYLCHLCPKKFRKKSHLTYHLSTHKPDTL